MKVTIAVKGRFHAFFLAYQLQKRGYLKKLITTYPKFKVKQYGIDPKLVKSLSYLEITERLFQSKVTSLTHRIFSNKIAKLATQNPSELFVTWSDNAARVLKKLKKTETTTILERGSTHIIYQQNILKEEYDHLGLSFNISGEKISKAIEEYSLADYLSVPSTFVRNTLLQNGIDEKKIIVTPYGVDEKKFNKIKKEDNRFRIITCGNLSLRKGTHYLINAFDQLKLPQTELWLIGPISSEIQSLIQKLKNKNIILIGPKPEFELYRYYSQGSAFCLPSVEEGMALVMLQAMACELPLIATPNTGAEDITLNNKTGFIIPIRSEIAIMEKLELLYKDRGLCAEMGKQAREHILNHFTWDHYGERMIKHYQNILSIS